MMMMMIMIDQSYKMTTRPKSLVCYFCWIQVETRVSSVARFGDYLQWQGKVQKYCYK